MPRVEKERHRGRIAKVNGNDLGRRKEKEEEEELKELGRV